LRIARNDMRARDRASIARITPKTRVMLRGYSRWRH
jgi:hypothetical protein